MVSKINPRKCRKYPTTATCLLSAMPDVSEHGELLARSGLLSAAISRNGFTQFAEGDILVAKITPCFENGKGALATGSQNGTGFGTTEFHVIRAT